MAHLPSDTVQRLARLERQLKEAQWKASSLPESEATRRIYWQVHARTLQSRIEDLEAMAQSSQLAFEELEDVRQESLL